MNILFLDIDGVLNSSRTRMAFGDYPHGFLASDIGLFDYVAVGALRNLCRAGSIAIVLSSSWREDFDAASVAHALDLPVIDSTPIHRGGSSRGGEIAAWLAAHPEVQRYCILDDGDDFLPAQQACFVRTDADEGLSYQALMELAAYFRISAAALAAAARPSPHAPADPSPT
jgi:hypothetical protein